LASLSWSKISRQEFREWLTFPELAWIYHPVNVGVEIAMEAIIGNGLGE
jgi:hypothetical protein